MSARSRTLEGCAGGKYYVDVRTLQYLNGIQHKNSDVTTVGPIPWRGVAWTVNITRNMSRIKYCVSD